MKPLYLAEPAERAERAAGYNQSQTALLKEFAERGFVIIDLDLPEFDQLAEEIKSNLAPIYKAGGRILDAWRRYESVRTLATNQQVLETLKLLYGREAFPFQTLNFNKGTEQATHSDTYHFDAYPKGYMAGVWVALEPIDAGNGPLHYYPGSHRLPQLTMADAGVTAFNQPRSNYREIYEPMVRDTVEKNGLEKVEASMRPGQALIWSANLLHGGSPIAEAGRSRHSQVTHYYFDKCLYYTAGASDPLIGRMFWKSPTDIRTKKQVQSYYHGEPFKVPVRRRLEEWTRNRIRYFISHDD